MEMHVVLEIPKEWEHNPQGFAQFLDLKLRQQSLSVVQVYAQET